MIHHEVIATSLDRNEALNSFHRVAEIASRIEYLFNLYNVTTVKIEGLSYVSHEQATRTLAGLHYLLVDRMLRVSMDASVIALTPLKKASARSCRAYK